MAGSGSNVTVVVVVCKQFRAIERQCLHFYDKIPPEPIALELMVGKHHQMIEIVPFS